MLFDKKKRLQECLDYLGIVEERFNKDYFPPNRWLQEMITISDITPRQTGATTAISELFDVDNDLYVSFNYGVVNEFNNKLYVLGKVSTKKINALKYIYIKSIPTENEKIVHMLAEKLGVNLNKTLSFTFPNSIKGKEITGIVWIDMGQFGMFEYRDVIYDMIKQLYDHYPKVKFIIC